MKMKAWQRSEARKGLLALVGSSFVIKQIQDGERGLKCKFCGSVQTPVVSTNGNIHCNGCESLLYDGPNDCVK